MVFFRWFQRPSGLRMRVTRTFVRWGPNGHAWFQDSRHNGSESVSRERWHRWCKDADAVCLLGISKQDHDAAFAFVRSVCPTAQVRDSFPSHIDGAFSMSTEASA